MTSEIDPYLEQQYNNRLAVPDFANYLADWSQRSTSYREKSTAHLNLQYGESEREILDIFPATTNTAPIHIFLHGGYWQALSKDSFSFVAEHINRQDECAIIVNYDLCPWVTVAEIMSQIQKATRWILANGEAFGDIRRIQITGHSAGAHLLARLVTTNWAGQGYEHPPFQRLNALSGLYDLQPLVMTSINQALQLNPNTSKQVSPLFDRFRHRSDSIELNLLVGNLESDEYKKQSSQLKKAWGRGLRAQYKIIPDAHHFSILDRFYSDYYCPL
ncbi:MAG: arylformamidase [Urechidicola sp.]